MTNGSNRYPDTIEWASFLPFVGPNSYRKNVEVGTHDGDGNGNHRKCQGCHPANLNHETKGPPKMCFFSHAITIFSPARREHEQGHGLAPSYVVDRKCFKKLLRPVFFASIVGIPVAETPAEELCSFRVGNRCSHRR